MAWRVLEHADRRWNVSIAAERRPNSPHWNLVFSFRAADPGQREVHPRDIGEDIRALAQDLILRVGELPVIAVRILPRGENIDHFRRPHAHGGPEDDAVDEREHRRVHANGERKSKQRDDGEPGCLEKLPEREAEILNHKRGLSLETGEASALDSGDLRRLERKAALHVSN